MISFSRKYIFVLPLTVTLTYTSLEKTPFKELHDHMLQNPNIIKVNPNIDKKLLSNNINKLTFNEIKNLSNINEFLIDEIMSNTEPQTLDNLFYLIDMVSLHLRGFRKIQNINGCMKNINNFDVNNYDGLVNFISNKKMFGEIFYSPRITSKMFMNNLNKYIKNIDQLKQIKNIFENQSTYDGKLKFYHFIDGNKNE